MKVIGIILAGGVGSRLGFEYPKQFMKFAGKSVLTHSVNALLSHSGISEVIAVVHKDYANLAKTLIANESIKIINGGSSRNHSTFNALKFIDRHFSNKDLFVLIHDAARPLVSQQIISDCILSLKAFKAVDVAIPAIDTIIKARDNIIESIPKRDSLYYGQTPQAFEFNALYDAYKLAYKDNPSLQGFSDDCGLFMKYQSHRIKVVQGDYANVKLTRLEDIPLLDNLLALRSATLKSKSDFKNLKDRVIVVFGGNSGIGAEIVKVASHYGAKSVALSRKNGCDIKSKRQIKQSLESIYDKYGKIDCIINMAGILHKGDLVDLPRKVIEDSIYANYAGAIFIAQVGFKYLAESSGMLILTSSSSYSRGRGGYGIYSSLKAGICNLTQALSEEWADSHIKVNCIAPSRTQTPMRVKSFGIEEKGSLLSAEFVAKETLRLYLSNTNGEILSIDKTRLKRG